MLSLEYLTETKGKPFFINSLLLLSIKENRKQATTTKKPPGVLVTYITSRSAFPGAY